MPPQAWSKKRERQYEHIKEGLEEHGRSEDVAEEIAARTVNKERARAGEAVQSSRTSTDDISSGRRGGLRSHTGPGGRTRDQLYEEAKHQGIKGRSRMTKAQLERAGGARLILLDSAEAVGTGCRAKGLPESEGAGEGDSMRDGQVRRGASRWCARAVVVICIAALATLAFPVGTRPADAITLGSVLGRVIDASGNGVPNLRVGVPATGSSFTTTAADGTYAISSVPTASTRYDVVLLAGCGRDQVKQVLVDGIETVNFTVGAPLKSAGYTCTVVPQAYIHPTSTVSQVGDDFSIGAQIGFDFPYFGAKRDDFATFDANGELTLPQTGVSYFDNSPIPQNGGPNGVIAPFWDDLLWDASSRLGSELGGVAPNRYRVYEWRDVLFQDGATGERVSFEVILYENGRIVFNYDGITTSPAHTRERGSGATVGIESPDGNSGIGRSFNQPYVDNGYAVVFSPAPK